MIPKKDILALFEKELGTTLRVMRAFPAGKFDFKPHERSSDAKKLMRTFVFEMYLLAAYALGEPLDRSKFQTYDPAKIEDLVADFEREARRVIRELGKMPDSNLEKVVEFGGRKFTTDEFILMMIHDQIHHRGQLTVYVRMADGKVPSIYGPSADDKETNL